MEEEIDFGFQSVGRFIYWPLKLVRADARSGAAWLAYVAAAN